MKNHVYLMFFIYMTFSNLTFAQERLECQDLSENSTSSLNLVTHETYGVLGELYFEELRAHLVCSQVTPSSMECLGHWKRNGQVQEKIELYVIESGQTHKAQAFFGLPSEYGKKQVWFECATELNLN